MPINKIEFGQDKKLLTAIKSSSHSIVEFPDCFVEKIVLDNLKGQFEVVYGGDLTVDWLEDNLMTFGLFGDDNSYMIIGADKLSEKVRNFFIDNEVPESKGLLFVTNKKLTSKKFLKKFAHHQYQPVKFWEMNKYLEYLAASFGITLKPAISNYLLSSLEHKPEVFFQSIMLLSHYPEKLGDLNFVKNIIRPSKLDNFEQADNFNSKNIKKVFLSLLLIESDYDVYRSLFTFLQGHILKVIDPSYLNSKPKKSKYDQGVLNASRAWDREDLFRLLRLFARFEVLAKSKSTGLRDQIRLEYLRN